MLSRAAGLALGYVADSLFGDPARWHPVAGFGSVATTLERRTYADSRAAGVVHVAALVGTLTAAAAVAERRVATHAVLHSLATALATWTVLGGASLEREAHLIAGMLESGDLPGARRSLTHLVGRDTSELDESEVARAVVESVAENTSDAVVAPLVLGALVGIPGLLGHRAANTLDAMVGHRSERYREFGWAAARLDDIVNVPGARLTALLATLLGPDPRGAARAWASDARRHPSPNAGPVEAAFAGALGVRLGGTNTYAERIEHRPVMGGGRATTRTDVLRATRLARRVDLAAAALGALIAVRRAVPGRPG